MRAVVEKLDAAEPADVPAPHEGGRHGADLEGRRRRRARSTARSSCSSARRRTGRARRRTAGPRASRPGSPGCGRAARPSPRTRRWSMRSCRPPTRSVRPSAEGASFADALARGADAAEEGARATIPLRRAQGPRELPRRAQRGTPGPGRHIERSPRAVRRTDVGRITTDRRDDVAKYVARSTRAPPARRFMIFDHGGNVVGVAQKEHEQIYPKPGWVEHDPAEIWARTEEVIDEALASAGIGNGRPRRDRHHQPARDGRRLGPEHRRAVHNAIVWQDTRTDKHLRRADGRRRPGPLPGEDRPADSRPTSPGPKIRWILDNVDGAPARAEAGDLLFGNMDTWVIWNLTGGTGRRPAHHRRHQRQPHDADGPRDARLGRRAAGRHRRPARDAARRSAPRARSTARRRSPAVKGVPIAGDLGDQQAALFGQTCFAVGEAKNTYGTGNFLLLNTGTEAVQSKNGLLTTVGYKIGDQPTRLRPRGLDRHHRRARAVAARQPEDDQGRRRRSRSWRSRSTTTAASTSCRRSRACSRRTGERRARRDRRPDPLRQRGPHRPRDARGDGLPEPRGRRGDERRLGRGARVAQGRRRHGAERPADAVPGRPARRAGDPAEGGRDDRARRGLRRRPRRRLLGRASRTCARTGSRTSAGSRRWIPTQRDEYRNWKKAVTKRSTGSRRRTRHSHARM